MQNNDTPDPHIHGQGAPAALDHPGQHLQTAEDARPRTTEIIVNARPHKVPGNVVTFEQVVKLAFPDDTSKPNVIFTVTYKHAASHPSQGELTAGMKVQVKNGTLFNVSRTVQS